MTAGLNFKVGFRTDVGRKRSQNQDNGIAIPELGLFIVADGMGGHRGGETASAIAVETISTTIRAAAAELPPLKPSSEDDRATISKTAVNAIQAANKAIYETSQQTPQLKGMGTTTTLLYFQNGLLTIGHVGDSRCYFLRPNAIWQATRDHSLVQEKFKAGIISRAQLKTDQMKNIITRAVGYESSVVVDTYQMEYHAGDCFMICSDGLSGLMNDLMIMDIIQKNLFEKRDAQVTVDQLVATANANGGDDNITSILVQVN